MSRDRLREWVGVALSILGLIPIFQSASLQLRILYSVALALLLALFLFLYRSGRGPQYETTLMKKTLAIHDREGKSATISREQTIRACYGNLQGIWWKNNIVDGSMADFKVDGEAPNDIETLGCQTALYKKFTNPLSKGETRTVVWSFEAINSLQATKEAFLHESIPGTKHLVMEVIFPKDRGFKAASFHVDVAGDDTHPQPGLKKVGCAKLLAEVKSPKPGHTYRIDWTW